MRGYDIFFSVVIVYKMSVSLLNTALFFVLMCVLSAVQIVLGLEGMTPENEHAEKVRERNCEECVKCLSSGLNYQDKCVNACDQCAKVSGILATIGTDDRVVEGIEEEVEELREMNCEGCEKVSNILGMCFTVSVFVIVGLIMLLVNCYYPIH